MLLNLSNHPLSRWSAEQLRAAENEFGAVEDVPFPQIEPAASLEEVQQIAEEYAARCFQALQKRGARERHAVHVVGEYTFTHLMANEMKKRNILCVASTTERITSHNPDGSKTTVFRFVGFRPYFTIV